jgi:hypothetical protein
VTTLEHALSLSRRGLSVIPVPSPDATHDGKVPAIAWREFQARRPTEPELRAWFVGESNLAVVCGSVSGVVVIDGDSPEAMRWLVRHLPYTPWQTQTRRGFHLWYRHPGVRVANRAKLSTPCDGHLAIDVRGDGGYVIAPGSAHATGVRYEYAGDWREPRQHLPIFDPAWIARPRPVTAAAPARPPSASDRPVIERARRYLASIPRPEIGHGSDAATLYAACRLVRGFGLAPADAEALLWEWAGGRPGWTARWIGQKVAHALRYGTEPIGALVS